MCVANEPARFRRNQEIQLEKLGFFKPYAVITQGGKKPSDYDLLRNYVQFNAGAFALS